jgi:glycosyltransferase involved in cell wall biosynthesis
MKENLRIAFFTDSYLEVNGVAMTSKRLENFAKSREYSFLTIHAGTQTRHTQDGTVSRQELKRSPLAIPMDAGLKYDPLFQRHLKLTNKLLCDFKPDVIHITGLNDVSILGAYVAYRFQIPVLASWHTNLHEFGARRLDSSLRFVPASVRNPLIKFVENKILDGAVLYYKMGKVVLAPNQELVDLLGKGTKRASYLMMRGVDTELYSPSKRTVNDGVFRLGYCGRLQVEKNVRLLAEVEKKLLAAGKSNFRFLIVGDGTEAEWLKRNMQNTEFTGFLEGEKLSEAYANMDVFLFPSETDAFGNVIQEAQASGVPSIVTPLGGPKFLVREGETGFVAKDAKEFARYAIKIMDDAALLDRMRKAALETAHSRSWDAVFEKLYQAYAECKAYKPPVAKQNLTVAPLRNETK